MESIALRYKFCYSSRFASAAPEGGVKSDENWFLKKQKDFSPTMVTQELYRSCNILTKNGSKSKKTKKKQKKNKNNTLFESDILMFLSFLSFLSLSYNLIRSFITLVLSVAARFGLFDTEKEKPCTAVWIDGIFIMCTVKSF